MRIVDFFTTSDRPTWSPSLARKACLVCTVVLRCSSRSDIIHTDQIMDLTSLLSLVPDIVTLQAVDRLPEDAQQAQLCVEALSRVELSISEVLLCCKAYYGPFYF
ncbi:hypothetical protein RRG08_017419 [Elysia crispata]|uniref:Uncharacterized protein n=1 Tax=Elysia crispata TaxID=231223 RepID=A0AAE0ZP40_9GAST|nr:hypothetical protein RRG08_017419 [Elysia crispata]